MGEKGAAWRARGKEGRRETVRNGKRGGAGVTESIYLPVVLKIVGHVKKNFFLVTGAENYV